jgi:type II secretory pathway pseudopilin PulG
MNVQHSNFKFRTAGFTMVEIALCLAVIGFALVAIIGVLPTGLNVQKDNREETVIDQDAVVWMDAIRNGAQGYNDLTNYVLVITNTQWYYMVTAAGTNLAPPQPQNPNVFVFTRSDCTLNGVTMNPRVQLTNGLNIVGLLSRPRIEWTRPNRFSSNYIVANVRALSGLAVEKFPQTNTDILDSAFAYRLIPENLSYVPIEPEATNYTAAPASEVAARSNYWRIVTALEPNAHDLRLTFRWPLLPLGSAGAGRQTFRTLAGGQLVPTNSANPRITYYFFEPSTYAQVP